MKKQFVFVTAAELCGGKESDWFCIAAVLATGYAKHYRPAREVSFEEMHEHLSASRFKHCILADNPHLDTDGQYKLKYAMTEYGATDYSLVNGWLENTVGGTAVFAFLTYV